MKISNVLTQLTGEDLLSIFNEFVKIDSLKIEDINLNNNIEISGIVNYKISVNFMIAINILSIENGVIIGKFSMCKLSGIGMFRPIRSLALKYLKKALEEIGIESSSYKDSIKIDTKKIINTIPYIDLDIENVYINKNMITVEISNIDISLEGKLSKENEKKTNKNKEKDQLILPIKKKEDRYYKGRAKLEKKLQGKCNNLSEYILLLPDIAALIYRLLKDNRVKIRTKVEISASIAYVIFPIDIIPEFIPFIGKIDDVAVLFFALNRVINEVPINIIAENWAGKTELVLAIKKAVEFISSYTNAANVDKLIETAETLTKL